MYQAFALLESSSVAMGVAAVDRMLKKSPVALLRCGTVHPGRWLSLVGGTVAATEEAHAEGVTVLGESLCDEVCLADPHPALAAAVSGERNAPEGEALGVLETTTSPALLRAVDSALKSVPVGLAELRMADDLGGKAVALIHGLLADVEAALEIAAANGGGAVTGSSLMPRLDDNLRDILAATTRFGGCASWQPEGGEVLEEE
ncbi:MAG: BMC domain-containing protein [bacterium]|nr:BMC domain-containing protein [bacterium]